MEEDEEELFLKYVLSMEKIACYPELLEGFANKLKDAVNEDDDVKDEVYKLMRSGEDRKWHVLNGMVLLPKRGEE